MKTIRMKVLQAREDIVRNAGDVVEVTDREAKALIRDRYAEEVRPRDKSASQAADVPDEMPDADIEPESGVEGNGEEAGGDAGGDPWEDGE